MDKVVNKCTVAKRETPALREDERAGRAMGNFVADLIDLSGGNADHSNASNGQVVSRPTEKGEKHRKNQLDRLKAIRNGAGTPLE